MIVALQKSTKSRNSVSGDEAAGDELLKLLFGLFDGVEAELLGKAQRVDLQTQRDAPSAMAAHNTCQAGP